MPMERPFSESDWLATPESVRRYVESLAQRIEQLESRLNQNSQNSSKPPSSDPPYQRPERGSKKSKRRRGGQKGHKGHRELKSVLERAVILCPGSVLQLADKLDISSPPNVIRHKNLRRGGAKPNP